MHTVVVALQTLELVWRELCADILHPGDAESGRAVAGAGRHQPGLVLTFQGPAQN